MTRLKIFLLSFLLLLLAAGIAYSQPDHHTFTLEGDRFLLDGKPFRIIAGEMHFARIPREYWRHRLQMARAMGLNTIATYVFWNYHEPLPGKFDFRTESRDIAAFIRMAQEEGLYVLLRPGPYACAEWEFGGYPWWLLKENDLIVRGKDPRFLKACERYLNRLGKEVAGLQITHGGPILMVQVENEYGSFGSDREYMENIRDMIRKAGFDVPLNRADGPSQCEAGSVPDVLPSLDGEYDPNAVRDTIRKYHNGTGPFFVSEFYPGWLDNWGLPHSVVPVQDFIGQYDTLLMNGISVSLYVVHGGTNFGFMNGANYDRKHPILPQPTTYDYDAPIDEAGRPTPKYFKLRETISKYLPAGTELSDPPPAPDLIAIPPFTLSESATIFENLGAEKKSMRPLSMEEMNQGYGYALYRTTLKSPAQGLLKIPGLRDYALVFLDGKRIGVLDRRLGQDSLQLDNATPNARLDILVENLGRINYGRKMTENRKGIVGKVYWGGKELKHWSVFPLPMHSINDVRYTGHAVAGQPALRKGTFILSKTGETFLDMRKWGKGVVWVNGHNIGRYWNIGPQQTLYVPGCWLKKGKNEIVVFEMLKDDRVEIQSLASPILDELNEQEVTITAAYQKENSAWRIGMKSGDDKAKIYYTLDGSEPIPNGNLYDSAVTLRQPAHIAARVLNNEIVSPAIARLDITPSLSTGKSITILNSYSPKYPAGGSGGLVDGLKGSLDFHDGFWQGYEGVDFEAVIDLGEAKMPRRISAGFLQDNGSWLFLPESVRYGYSADSIHFTDLPEIVGTDSLRREGSFIKSFDASLQNVSARFIKIHAKNIGVCPPWHPGSGGKAWIFVDEIMIE